MNSTSYNAQDFPAVNGGVVTERIAKICAERGHAVHMVNGVDTGVCPRCGDVTEGDQGPSLTALRRYALRSELSGYTLRELKDALTLQEMAAERHKLDRPLSKGDYVNLLTEKTIRSEGH